MVLFLGVDPARTGAAVLLDEGLHALAGFFWTPRSRSGVKVWEMVFALRKTPEGGLHPDTPWWVSRAVVSPFGAVGERIREILRTMGATPYHLAGENAVMGRGVDTSISVARNAGRVLGPLESLASGQEAEWVRATEWRSLLLGLHHRTPREEAKEKSKRGMPLRIHGLPELVRLLGDADDLTDAAGVAEWLVLLIKHPSSVRRGGRKKKPTETPSGTPRKSSSSGPPSGRTRGVRGR